MATDSLNLKIITPVGVVTEEQVSSVKLPASEGEIGVLPAHVRYIGNLGIGVLEYDSLGDKKTKKLVISEGFCSVDGENLVVLTDKVIFADNVNKAEYASEKEALKIIVNSGAPDTSEWVSANNKLKEIEAIEALVA